MRLPIVFLGPSLPADEARRIVQAELRPPVQRGDLERIPPGTVVGLIDGVFDQVLAVSPREVRDAVRRGVHVFGSSSMGALRAAEVPGVVGIGRVHRMFADGTIEDDDEVALVFSDTFQCLSEPLVNVRYAVERLARPGTISRELAARILRAAKELFYPDRVYPRILERAGVAPRDRAQLAKMLASFDLKREDAISLLEHLARQSTPSRARPRAAADTGDARLGAAERVSPHAPILFWEYGDRVAMDDLVRFLKLTGRFEPHARSAIARFVLQGNALRVRVDPSLPKAPALVESLSQRIGATWEWRHEEEVAVTLRDLGVGVGELHERLLEEAEARQRVITVARRGSKEFLGALRVELLFDDLTLKRETVRCGSLAFLARIGERAGGRPDAPERREAEQKIAECVFALDYRAALRALATLGVSKQDTDAFADVLALARRAARAIDESTRPSRESVRSDSVPSPVLCRSPKVKGQHRYCMPFARAYAHTKRLARVVGVKRVSVITGLSDIGIPVAQTHRPESRWSISVGGGKSHTTIGAKVGAVMEEVETWAQERYPLREEPDRTASYASVRGRAVDPATLDLPYDSIYQPDLEIGWRRCTLLGSGKRILVPAAAMDMQRVTNDVLYSPRAGRKVFSTSGLASGFTLEEALTHAICEVIERHAEKLAELAIGNPGTASHGYRRIDPATVPRSIHRLFGKIERAGHEPRLFEITSEVDVPTFLAAIVSSAIPDGDSYGRGHTEAHGTATHPDPETAANMALLEAVQTIVGNVSGAREDLTVKSRSLGRHERTRLRTREGLVFMRGIDTPKKRFDGVRGLSSRDARVDVEWLLARLRDAGCPDVVFVEYTRPEILPVRVVRVLIPGLETPNPFYTGPRARLALVRDLMPAR